jgi:hypothetical protein
MNRPGERGSTLPLILGFFLVALMVIAGAVAAGDAVVQQRGLQDVCDGAATSAAASALDLDRAAAPGTGDYARFGAVQRAVADYLARDSSRRDVTVRAALSADARTLTLRCAQTLPVAFGAMFGRGGGVHHTVTSSVRVRLS